MFFRNKSFEHPSIRIFHNNACIYQGFLKDIPLKESVIIEKSIHFFHDPEPCEIHRTAVRLRITEELTMKLLETEQSEGCRLLMSLCPFETIEEFMILKQPTNR